MGLSINEREARDGRRVNAVSGWSWYVSVLVDKCDARSAVSRGMRVYPVDRVEVG